jgi:hypothetical protein
VYWAKVAAVTLILGSSSKIQTRYLHGSIFRRRQLSMRLYQMALVSPASSLPMKSQFFAPSLVGRMPFSMRLLSIS